MPMEYAGIVVLSIISAYTGLETLYLLIFSVAGRLHAAPPAPMNRVMPDKRVVILIPAYKEDAVIVETARQALNQSYPADLFEVAVIADSLQPPTIQQLQRLPVRLIKVSFENSTKAGALNVAMQQLPGYDIAVVLDADNRMDFRFLESIMKVMEQGFRVVQGHRMAKDTHTSVALLDAISEEINNHIFRKGHRALNLSSALIGSGMAFDYAYFKEIMSGIQAINGFDKELEFQTLRKKIKIAYAEEAIVSDEKVPDARVFKQQRTRWIAAQISCLQRYFIDGWIQLFTSGNVDYFNKVVQTLWLPRILLLGLVAFELIGGGLLVSAYVMFAAACQLAILFIVFYISTPKVLLKLITFRELINVPILGVRFAQSVLNIGQAKSKFLHTPHGKVS
jgi:1,2-diacylglycerol 3-beta-glucosyltransferase